VSLGPETHFKTLAEIHPFDPNVLENPFEYYRRLHAEAPIYRDTHTGIFFVSSYDRVVEVLRNPERFSSRFSAGLGGQAAANPKVREVLAEGYPPVDTMLTADPPEHGRFRGLVNKAFTPRRVRKLSDRVQEIADGLIDSFASEGQFEALAQYAVPLPLSVIAEQLGVPLGDLERFRRWTDGFTTQLSGLAQKEDEVEAAKRIVEFQKYFAERIDEVAREPRDDILSDLVRARIEGERPLDVAESLSIIQQLLVAGNETTAATIAEGILLLIRHPEQMALVLEDEERIPNMIEEVLRLASPTHSMWRVVTEDCELGGIEIPAKSFMMIRYGAANRDEKKFPDPDRFDVLRENANEQLAFGNGIHFCIGAMLARKEMSVAFQSLFRRLSGLRLRPDSELRYKPSMLLRGLRELHLEFDKSL
jgi:cytochrome P450